MCCNGSAQGVRLAARPACNAWLYDVLVVSDGRGERFTIERDAPLSDGDAFERNSESYRVLAIQPPVGPFDGVMKAEWLVSSGSGEFVPA